MCDGRISRRIREILTMAFLIFTSCPNAASTDSTELSFNSKCTEKQALTLSQLKIHCAQNKNSCTAQEMDILHHLQQQCYLEDRSTSNSRKQQVITTNYVCTTMDQVCSGPLICCHGCNAKTNTCKKTALKM